MRILHLEIYCLAMHMMIWLGPIKVQSDSQVSNTGWFTRFSIFQCWILNSFIIIKKYLSFFLIISKMRKMFWKNWQTFATSNLIIFISEVSLVKRHWKSSWHPVMTKFFKENLQKVTISRKKINHIKTESPLESAIDKFQKLMGTYWGHVWYFIIYI